MHKIIKCSCGKIITQCRCFNPNKIVEVWEDGCDDCKKKLKHSINLEDLPRQMFVISAEVKRKQSDDDIYIPEPTD